MTAPTLLPASALAEWLGTNDGWRVEEGWLRRTYPTDGWAAAVMLANAIGYLAEAADHHPDLEVRWNQVVVKLQTHQAKGITSRDTSLAQAIDATASWRPTSPTDSPAQS